MEELDEGRWVMEPSLLGMIWLFHSETHRAVIIYLHVTCGTLGLSTSCCGVGRSL